MAYSLDWLTRAGGELLQRAVAEEEIRGDIDPEDLFRAVVGMCYAHDMPLCIAAQPGPSEFTFAFFKQAKYLSDQVELELCTR